MTSAKKLRLPTIGWREWVALPDLGIDRVKAKVDTGARSSSIHAVDVEEFDNNGVRYVRFRVHPLQRTSIQSICAEAPILEYRSVRSSSGKATRRPVIVTRVNTLGEMWDIELTLANRDEMGFRMLLGREAIRGRMLVDPGKSYFGGKPPKANTPRAKKKNTSSGQNKTA